MSEHTKGKLKWERCGYRCRLYVDDAWIGEVYVGYGVRSIKEMEANAKHFVKCWNSHNDLPKPPRF